MSRRSRIALALCALATLGFGGGVARAAVRARVAGAFPMSGVITTALRVRGEHRGQRITREWTFAGHGCTRHACRTLTLQRERAAGRTATITLRLRRDGTYAGSGTFTSGLRCRGRVYPAGLIVPFALTVRVTRLAVVQGIAFATWISGRYVNRARRDVTPCPLGPSHDAARYTGSAPAPSPPRPAFTAQTTPLSNTASFSDTSAPGTGGAPIVSTGWSFGDPASGSADASTAADPVHTFSHAGTYAVSLTVVDANGLQATGTQPVTVPGPVG